MVCNYLRDLCLDEEKRVYQIGNDETNGIVKKVIPSIFLRGCYQFLGDDPGDVLTGIAKLEKNELEKKGFLIISADVSYCRMLRTALDKDFNVVVSNGPVNDIEPYLKDAYCVLIGLDVKGDFLEMAKLRILLNKARKKGNCMWSFWQRRRSSKRRSTDTSVRRGCVSIKSRILSKSPIIWWNVTVPIRRTGRKEVRDPHNSKKENKRKTISKTKTVTKRKNSNKDEKQ